MKSFLVSRIPPAGGEVVVTGDELAHMRVRRIRAGQEVFLSDGQGNHAQARVIRMTKDAAILDADPPVREYSESFLKISLLFAWTKSAKPELIVQKATELGVWQLIPFSAARSIAGATEIKVERLRKIAAEAAKQCGRSRIPAVIPCAGLDSALALAPPKTGCFFLNETERSVYLSDAVLHAEGASEFALIVGPEGGMDDAERETLEQRAISVSIGPRILRVETACIAGLTIMQTIVGDMGSKAERGL